MTLYHGSPFLFDHFELCSAGESTGCKFGCGVYLTEAEASAVHYSQPRKCALTPDHYLYTVEIAPLTADNHIISAQPVAQTILERTAKALGTPVAEDKARAGKVFRKWVGMTLTGAKEAGAEEEKAAADFLDSIGVYYNVWPTAQTKPDGLKNIAVFRAERVSIVKREHIDIEKKGKKWILTGRREI